MSRRCSVCPSMPYDHLDKPFFDVQDVIDAGCLLEPIKCRLCGSLAVIYYQYIGDACCEECGEWQVEQ